MLFNEMKKLKVHKVATLYFVIENIFSSRNKCLKAITQKKYSKI
jgi:hypothetical protein